MSDVKPWCYVEATAYDDEGGVVLTVDGVRPEPSSIQESLTKISTSMPEAFLDVRWTAGPKFMTGGFIMKDGVTSNSWRQVLNDERNLGERVYDEDIEPA